MITKNEIVNYLERWSAQYSPINPIEPEEIDAEMQNLSSKMDALDFPVFLSVLNELNKSLLPTFMEFAFYYINKNADILSHDLIDILQYNGPSEVIDLISYTKKKELYRDFIRKVDYNILNKDAKISLIDAFDFLKNEEAINYLKNLKNIETDTEILEEIDLVIHNLNL